VKVVETPKKTIVLSGSDDTTARIWDFATGKSLQKLKGHTGYVQSIESFEGFVITGSVDGNIKLWDQNSGKLKKTLSGHLKVIWQLRIHEGKIFSASDDQTIRVWDPKTGDCLKTLEGHGGPVSCLAFFDKYLLSGSWDHSIRAWNIESLFREDDKEKDVKCEFALVEHQDDIQALYVRENTLFSAGADGKLKEWNLK